jgi:hypothetical protein
LEALTRWKLLPLGARQEHAVDVDSDAGVEGGCDGRGADAADLDVGVESLVAGVENDVWNDGLDIVQPSHPGLVHEAVAEHGYRDRSVLEALFAFAGAHDDLFDGGRLDLRQNFERQRVESDRTDCENREPAELHHFAPLLARRIDIFLPVVESPLPLPEPLPPPTPVPLPPPRLCFSESLLSSAEAKAKAEAEDVGSSVPPC